MSELNVLAPEPPGSATQSAYWHGLHGAGSALAISEAAQKQAGLCLVICADSAQGQRLEQELTFFCAGTDVPVWHLPDWETLPYDSFSPHQDIISERLATLYNLQTAQRGILVVAVNTLMQCTAAPEYIATQSLQLARGQHIDTPLFRQQLVNSGYTFVDTVYEHGEFALRGSIIDLFPMGSKNPVRIDLFDDEIESLRFFEAGSQRTVEIVERIDMLPAREFPLDDAGIKTFRQHWHDSFSVDHSACTVYRDVSDGIASAGIEYYLPLFYGQRYDLLDHIPADSWLVLEEGLHAAAEVFWAEIDKRYSEFGVDHTRPLLPPREVFTPVETLFSRLGAYASAVIKSADAADDLNMCTALPNLELDRQHENSHHRLAALLASSADRVLFCAESAGRLQTLLDGLQKLDIEPLVLHSWQEFLQSEAQYCALIAPLYEGCTLHGANISLVCEDQLHGSEIRQRYTRETRDIVNPDAIIKNLTELQLNAPVVHSEHGVGRYRGLILLEVQGEKAEFLHLEYAEQAKLYVPVSSLHVINRYLGADDEHVPLHRLGSEQWQKAKRKAAEKAADVAAELLLINAQRASRPGTAFSMPDKDYRKFADSFPFEETKDQQTSIDAVLADLCSAQPMDRLICGDVGFGKTEVALRAAFIAVHNSRQVVVLVPTTLLAQQHYETFKDRFADWPVNVEVLSRFKSNNEQNAAIEALADGKIDIIVGTHKLLQKNIRYRSLGLLIIDEEHRFGVNQKETLKALRSEVDILTLTATPIPRTLNMAMSGLRDLSIIASPPAKRLSINTFVREYQQPMVREAILREILRGGQVYYLHNEVKTIENTLQSLQELVPEARINVAHGQMRERALESVMSDFYHKRFNVLLCTTIIETGIDVPSANTIIIERADKFGLAQLHQLRGRVGRSHHQAYAYLLTPHFKAITADANKRLEAIEQAGDLGAGFTLATHDLEIRGAGELLGEDQSGQIQSVGFTMYMEMLDRAVRTLRSGKQIDLARPSEVHGEIDVRAPALIPEDYLPDVHNRLVFYKRISTTDSDLDRTQLKEEMIDRFGPLPEPITNLFRISSLRQTATELGIKKIHCGPKYGRLEFASDTPIPPLSLVTLIQQQSEQFQMDGASTLKFSAELQSVEERFAFIDDLLGILSADIPSP